jgi:cellulose biosynthesis protein BcsQ
VKTLAVYNIKGGVGKTAAAVNLSHLAARGGARVLVWDLDPQGAATFYFRIRPKLRGGGRALVLGRNPLDVLLKGTDYANLDLVPSDFSYRHMDLMLEGLKKPTRRIRKLLAPLDADYDYAFLDCPPGISLVSESVLEAADALLVPVIPTTLSARTLEQLRAFCARQGHAELRILPFFSIVSARKRLHRELMERLPQEGPEWLRAVIPDSADVERMGVRRAPVCAYARGSQACEAYTRLWEELAARLAAWHRLEESPPLAAGSAGSPSPGAAPASLGFLSARGDPGSHLPAGPSRTR